jgi:membrane-bound lytic murein transglycosylase D
MNRGAPYIAFIRREIEERNLPEELLYLPVIESQYLSTAVSRSGAAGLWQFMKNSIGPFDMKVNDWMDERRDFWKSTQGALRKLEDNYNSLDDWALALAAYNAGLGAVNRTIQSSGIRDYWLLSEKKLLKTETVHYVPKLLAVAYVLSNARRFGLDPLWPQDPQWVRVAVGRSADLNILAAEAGMEANTLKNANRELSFNVTPPGGNYYLKVPAADAEKVSAVLAREDIQLIKYYFHTIRSGDTLSALALHYGITVDQILEANPGTQARSLRIGVRLLVPAFKEAAPYQRPEADTGGLVFSGNHLVKKGETLWSIALAYEVDPEVLAEVNGMDLNDILREGRSLKTPIK